MIKGKPMILEQGPGGTKAAEQTPEGMRPIASGVIIGSMSIMVQIVCVLLVAPIWWAILALIVRA